MSFGDFIRQPEIERPMPLGPSELLSDRARDAYESWSALTADLDALWQDYLEVGGFPRAVAEHSRLGGVSEGFLDELAAWLRTDIDAEAPAESVDLLIDQLTTRTAAPFNVRNAAEALAISRDALNRRITRMQNTYAVLRCPQRRDGHIVPGAQGKLYLTDPVLSQIPARRRPGLNHPDMSHQTESVLGVGLARSIDATRPGRWEDGDTIGYYRTSGDGEIDFASVPLATPSGDRHTVPMECKWVAKGWRREAQTLRTVHGHGIVATKDVTDTTTDVWAVPAPMLAFLLS